MKSSAHRPAEMTRLRENRNALSLIVLRDNAENDDEVLPIKHRHLAHALAIGAGVLSRAKFKKRLRKRPNTRCSTSCS